MVYSEDFLWNSSTEITASSISAKKNNVERKKGSRNCQPSLAQNKHQHSTTKLPPADQSNLSWKLLRSESLPHVYAHACIHFLWRPVATLHVTEQASSHKRTKLFCAGEMMMMLMPERYQRLFIGHRVVHPPRGPGYTRGGAGSMVRVVSLNERTTNQRAVFNLPPRALFHRATAVLSLPRHSLPRDGTVIDNRQQVKAGWSEAGLGDREQFTDSKSSGK